MVLSRTGLLAALMILLGPSVGKAGPPAAGPSAGAAASAPADRIALRVLYAGHSGSERETDFVAFLRQHFTDVKTMDLAGFPSKDGNFDVAIIDYDGDYFVDANKPQPPHIVLPPDYSRPVVTVGVLGGMICGQVRLKTGYL